MATMACQDRPSDEGVPVAGRVLVFPETVTLGGMGAEGAAAFGELRGVALLSDESRIVVADGQTQQLHLFTVRGEHLSTLGGRGGGPGEHQAIRHVWGLPAGGFCTWDVQTLRVTRFDEVGEVVGSGRADLEGMEAIRPAFHGFLDDCSFVLRDERPAMDMSDVPEGLRRDTVRFVHFAPTGSQTGTVLRRQNVERWFRNRDRSWGHVELVFGEALFGFPMGRELWVGTSDALAWSRLDLSGDTLGHVELDHTPRTATDVEMQAERDRLVTEVEASSRTLPVGTDLAEAIAESRRDGIRDAPARDRIPAYDAVSRGPGSVVWVREHPRPADTVATWLLLDSEGERRGSLVLPRADSIVVGTARTLVVAARDSLDVPLLRILRRRDPTERASWILEDLEVLADDTLPLAGVYVLALGPGGRLALADGPPVRALLRTPDGSVVQLGAVGDGPSEYRYVDEIGFLGDTVWVTDVGASKVIFFDADGRYLTDRRVSLPGEPTSGPLRPLRDGSWLVSEPEVDISIVLNGWADTRTFVRADGDGRLDTVYVQPLPLQDYVGVPLGEYGPDPDARLESMHPVPRGPVFLQTPSGTGFWVIARAAPESVDSASFEVHRLDPSGDTVGTFAVPYVPTAISEGWKDDWYAAQARTLAEILAAPEARIESLFRDAVAMPAFFPPFSSARAGADGRLWLREWRRDTLRSEWLVLDSAGSLEGHLSAPPGFRLMAADSTHAVGVLSDTHGVHTVVRARISGEVRP